MFLLVETSFRLLLAVLVGGEILSFSWKADGGETAWAEKDLVGIPRIAGSVDWKRNNVISRWREKKKKRILWHMQKQTKTNNHYIYYHTHPIRDAQSCAAGDWGVWRALGGAEIQGRLGLNEGKVSTCFER
jgi:hypothetical protein